MKKHENILYTGKGDSGTTTLYDCKQGRISKSSILVEALGSTDELNAYLGIIKVYSEKDKVFINSGKNKTFYSEIIENIQQNLFVIQAELGGSKISVNKKELIKTEKIIGDIAKILPPIKSFTISGGTLLGAGFDYARTLARKSERRIISVSDEGSRKVNKETLSYMNRLSSLLFALSRYANYFFSVPESHPKYNKKN